MKKLHNSFKRLAILLPFMALISLNGFSQATPNPPDWNTMMFQPNANFYTIKTQVETFFNTFPELKEFEEEDEDEEEGIELSYLNYLRWEYFWRGRVDDGTAANSGSFSIALQHYKQSFSNNSIYSCHQAGVGNNLNSNWTELGPTSRGTMMGTKVKLNIMENNYYGFCMENGGNIGEQGNAAANDVSDNQWINNIYYDTYSIGNSNQNPQNNTFFDVQNTPNYTITTTFNDGSSLAIPDNIISPFNPADCADHKGWRVSQDTDDAISDTIPDSLITEEERWIRERQLFSVVTSEEIIDTPSVIMEDFILEMEGEPISEFKKIDTYISKAFRDTLSGEPDTIQVDSAKVRNLAVVDIKLIEFYSKIVNDIYLSTIAHGNENFTQDQKDWLYAIAAMCPFEGGPTVYRARVLVAIFDDEILFLDYDCDPNSTLRKASEQQQTSMQQHFIKLYPNPANDKLFLDYFMPDNVVGSFYLTDISGKQIFTSKLKKYNNHLIIPCEKINSGIYFFKIVTNGTVSKTGKVSIIH